MKKNRPNRSKTGREATQFQPGQSGNPAGRPRKLKAGSVGKSDVANLDWIWEMERSVTELLDLDVIAGIPEAIAAKVARDATTGPAGPNRQDEIRRSNEAYSAWMEARLNNDRLEEKIRLSRPQACNVLATASVTC